MGDTFTRLVHTTGVLLKAFMDMRTQLVNAPWSSCNSNDRHVKVSMPDHCLQGREDLFVRKITGDAEEDECV